ncbi:MAG: citrate transporter [Rhodocyclaceae bacterium]|nr:citrate transporter [Rhodocyclaceae bacterium]MBK9625938.1 citrate transporter [Rhodocyclaceae bacterium]MBL0074661.1 citrate transporter [Rhodocyclaceae bacterium]MBP6109494.1 citrate transporter [Rhodocyclaceae bacterium]MBP6278630.1 citrate transporter [Rhodocyclaceae bacterium]
MLPEIAGIPIDFILFALTLLGVALFHNQTLFVALAGVGTISLYKIVFTGFPTGPGVSGWLSQLAHEWVTLVNLFCLLMGFALLSRHFEKSRVPAILPKYLPDDWKGGFMMLVIVFVLSSFLDNIAAALIGGAMAHQLFKAKVHVGYLAAIVAASNAGGSGSVLGDTTTTMMWIHGVAPSVVLDAYVAAVVALLIVGVIAAKQQHAYSPIIKNTHIHTQVDWPRIAIVALILFAAMATNIMVNTRFPDAADHFPFLGVAVWVALLVTIPVRRHDWEVMPETFKGAIFLLSLVVCASMMPVEKLPSPSWQTALGLGFVSAVFDNIPLTALALKQGGYDWGFLAYAVGFGGSMIWFGSSAGVALASMYPEARSVGRWLREGWHVALAYVAGFFVLLATLGWHPDAPI